MNDTHHHRKEWLAALWHAMPISIFVLATYYYWFGVADRYIVFLYNHNMGPLVPDTSPFSAVTSSRYWMAGLVCGGLVLALYATTNWLLGRIWQTYEPPAWQKRWAVTVAPLLVGIPLITMLVNSPTLSPCHAARTTLAAVVGVGLALAPARMAARRPWDLISLCGDGLALGGIIQIVSMLERGLSMLSRGNAWALFVVAGGSGGAIILLLIMTWLRWWQRKPMPSTLELLVAGLCAAYLVWPLIHHLVFTDGYYYITNMQNFFSERWGFQFLAWAVAGGVALALTKWRMHMAMRRNRMPTSPPTPERP